MSALSKYIFIRSQPLSSLETIYSGRKLARYTHRQIYIDNMQNKCQYKITSVAKTRRTPYFIQNFQHHCANAGAVVGTFTPQFVRKSSKGFYTRVHVEALNFLVGCAHIRGFCLSSSSCRWCSWFSDNNAPGSQLQNQQQQHSINDNIRAIPHLQPFSLTRSLATRSLYMYMWFTSCEERTRSWYAMKWMCEYINTCDKWA